MSAAPSIGIGAVAGFALGVLVGVSTDLPLAPEAGALLGVLGGWLLGRKTSGRGNSSD
jgi:hypothetical protein